MRIYSGGLFGLIESMVINVFGSVPWSSAERSALGEGQQRTDERLARHRAQWDGVVRDAPESRQVRRANAGRLKKDLSSKARAVAARQKRGA